MMVLTLVMGKLTSFRKDGDDDEDGAELILLRKLDLLLLLWSEMRERYNRSGLPRILFTI